MTVTLKPHRDQIWPVGDGARRGWPSPDAAWDDECGIGRWTGTERQGWLPWAVWQRDRTWYVGFFTCDRGHAWTCGFSGVHGWSEVKDFLVSPFRYLPSDQYLRRHVGEPEEIRLRLMVYPPQRARAGR